MAFAKQVLKLNDGRAIPVLGLGVYKSEPGAQAYDAVLNALKLGYRHIDTAQFYQNEADVGKAVRDSGIPREEIWVTTKLWSGEPADALAHSLKLLGLDYVDLYLIHAPIIPNRIHLWKEFVKLQEKGLAKSIGVSNYGVHHLEEIFANSNVVPAVNQIELHPWLHRQELVDYCKSKNIVLQAYSPLTRGFKLNPLDPQLGEIAKSVGKTGAQVLVRWSIEKGFVTLPKSVKTARLLENADVFDWSLPKEAMDKLDAFESHWVTMPAWDPVTAP